jgi:hypothetical protein
MRGRSCDPCAGRHAGVAERRADHGEPQSVTLVPVETRAGIDAVCAAPQGCLGGFVRRLGKDRPKGAARHRVRRVT